MTEHTLILLRHGESEWNQKNLFTGWVDVDLTDKGRAEAARGGQLMKDAGILPDVVHTSVQRRAITTANLALDAADRHWIPVHRSWRLNERHYGALQGLDKAATREKYGDEQFMLWRRSFDTPPPPIEVGSEFDQTNDPRYAGIEVPLTECLKDVIPRMMPYWENEIRSDLADGKTVLVTAHGNSLRALVKHLDGISDDDIAGLNIPTGMPLVYGDDDGVLTARRNHLGHRVAGGAGGDELHLGGAWCRDEEARHPDPLVGGPHDERVARAVAREHEGRLECPGEPVAGVRRGAEHPALRRGGEQRDQASRHGIRRWWPLEEPAGNLRVHEHRGREVARRDARDRADAPVCPPR